MPWYDIFRSTGTPEPYNNFGRLPEDEVKALVDQALSKIDWSKAALPDDTSYVRPSYRYGNDIYKKAKGLAEIRAKFDAQEAARKEITADSILSNRERAVEKREKEYGKHVDELRELRALITGALRDANFKSLADDIARRLEDFDERQRREAAIEAIRGMRPS